VRDALVEHSLQTCAWLLRREFGDKT
jgi:hypothetical protein